jgi:anti-sigma factor RsiW
MTSSKTASTPTSTPTPTIRHVDEELSAFHFGALDPSARQAFELHVSVCTECLLLYFQFKRDMEAAEEAPSRAPAHLRERTKKRVEAALASRNVRVLRWHRPAAFAFAFAAVLLASLSVQRVATGPGAPPRAAMLR